MSKAGVILSGTVADGNAVDDRNAMVIHNIAERVDGEMRLRVDRVDSEPARADDGGKRRIQRATVII